MPTTILHNETLKQAYARRFAECQKERDDFRETLIASVKELGMHRTACQMALEALERGPWTEDTRIKSNQAIAELREVLE